MSAITDARVVLFSNEQTRPMAESFRALYYKCKDTKRKWDTEISALITGNVNGDTLTDGRLDVGASVLTKADIINMQTQVGAFITTMEQSGVLDVIEKPCVRPLIVG